MSPPENPFIVMFPALKPSLIRSRRTSCAMAGPIVPDERYAILIFRSRTDPPASLLAFARFACTEYGCSRLVVIEPGRSGGGRGVPGGAGAAPACFLTGGLAAAP